MSQQLYGEVRPLGFLALFRVSYFFDAGGA